MKISAAIITLNEERNLGRCLDSLRDVVDEVVVVDSGSTDGTERICRERGAVFVVQPFLGYGPQKSFAAARVAHEWLLSLDADEALSPELAAAIARLRAEGPGADAYEVNRLNWYCGRFLRHAGMYPDRKVRLWRRGAARWSDDAVHELAAVAPGARVARLEGDLLHYTCLTREQHLSTIERFTTLNAEKLREQGKRSSAWRRVVSPAARFFRMYFLQLGFLDGRAGYDVSRLTAYSVWLKYEKLRRLERRSLAP